MIRLKNAAEVAVVRARLLKQQGFKCAVCGCSLKGRVRGGATLDHDHDTGVCRGVLCKVCNTGEGKLRTVAVRYGGGKDGELEWLRNMIEYKSIHKQPMTRHTQYLYPEKRRKVCKKKQSTK